MNQIPNQKRKAAETRELIFEAAIRILIAGGLSSLTLAKVASEAGLSKGGLLYHFPNKVALINAIFENQNCVFETRLEELCAEEGHAPGAWLKAYARASVEQIVDPQTASLYASLFAAEEKYASAHALMRQKYVDWQVQVENCGLDPNWATLIRLTVDGLWFSEMHQYGPPDLQRRDWMIKKIQELVDEQAILSRSESQ
ncbi:MAG: TetR family transcriptional regulator [Anaerolineae bacterium]